MPSLETVRRASAPSSRSASQGGLANEAMRSAERVGPPAVGAGVRRGQVLRQELDESTLQGQPEVLGPAAAGSDGRVEGAAGSPVWRHHVDLLRAIRAGGAHRQ